MREVKIMDHMMREMMEDAFLSQVDPRRRQEKKDGNMLSEDHSAMANLSPKPIHKMYDENFFKHNCNKAGNPANIDDKWGMK